ncbi:unnamed protein product [Bubo scandiacus]
MWQQVIARSDLGGGSSSVGSSKGLFCTVVQGRQGMAREIALWLKMSLLIAGGSTGMTYAGSYSGNSNGSAVTVPYDVPSITSAYVNITSHILYACDIWEKADVLAGKNTVVATVQDGEGVPDLEFVDTQRKVQMLRGANQVFFSVCCLKPCLPWLMFISWLSFRMLQDDLQLSDSEESGDDQPNPPTSNKWQLSNWLTKVNPPAVPTETLSETAPGDGCEDTKEQGQGLSSNSSHQCTEPREPQHKSLDQAAMAPQDIHLLSKDNCQKSPVHAQEPSPRQTVGLKRPSKAPVHEGPKKGLKVESDPGPLEGRDQSARDKTKVKPKGKPGARKWDLKRKTTDTPDKSLQKRKRAVERKTDGKKKKSEKETKSLQSSAEKDSNKLKASKASLETQKKGVLLPLPLPPVSPAPPAPKSTKTARKRPRSESDELPAMDHTARNKSSHTDPLLSKHRKEERNHADLSKDIKGSAGDVTNPFGVTPLPDGTSKLRRPQIKLEKSTGVPSHPSAMPCPASSVSSQPGLNASNCSGNSTGSSFSVPYNIPNITSSYVNTTSYIIYAYDIWERADALAGKNMEFFADLSTVTCALALNSSVPKAVRYARQGLQWLRWATATP